MNDCDDDFIVESIDECRNGIVFTTGDGVPIRVENLETQVVKEDPLELFMYLNDLGQKHGIGRIDIVENRCAIRVCVCV